MTKKSYYLHFETKPSFPELDVLFQSCLQYEPCLSTSYYLLVDKDSLHEPFAEVVRSCFPRYSFALCQLKDKQHTYRHFENNYVKTDLEDY